MVPIKLLDKKLTSDITNFFISYNECKARNISLWTLAAVSRPLDLVEEARKRAHKKGK
jgi:hypothetical protein